MKRILVLLIFLLIGAVLVFSYVRLHSKSSIPPPKTIKFSVGSTRAEVREMAGPPASQLNSDSGVGWDIYWRKTATNEYRISITYDPDFTNSKLHPVDRVSYIRFELDHPRPIVEVLADLPETSSVCPYSCAGAVGFNGLIIAPAGAKTGDLIFFTMNDERDISSPISELRLNKGARSPFEGTKAPTVIWNHKL